MTIREEHILAIDFHFVVITISLISGISSTHPALMIFLYILIHLLDRPHSASLNLTQLLSANQLGELRVT